MVQRDVWDYKLYPTASGEIQPIAVPVTAGDRVEIYWENIAVKNLTHRLFAFKDGATFVERSTDMRSSEVDATGSAIYTVATDGTLILGGLHKYPDSLWGTYALRADFLGMNFL